MKVYALFMVAGSLLAMAGCGGGDDRERIPVTTQIFSDPQYDGDIEQTAPGQYVVTQGMSGNVQTVLSGIDPVAGTEFRGFLDFDLSGPGGVPGDAFIDSAFLEFLVDDVEPTNGSLPVRVDLVGFQPPNLIGTDFDRTAQPAIASVLIPGDITNADVGNFVSVDVTSLMIKAQQLGLVDFQVRVMEDLGPAIYTLMSIDDSTASDRSKRAPLLTVDYH